MGQAPLKVVNAQRLLLYNLFSRGCIFGSGIVRVLGASSESNEGSEGKNNLQHDVTPSTVNSASCLYRMSIVLNNTWTSKSSKKNLMGILYLDHCLLFGYAKPMLVLGNIELKSRLMVGTGRYSDFETMAAVHDAAAMWRIFSTTSTRAGCTFCPTPLDATHPRML
jgi:hypothetical protein